MSRVLHLLAEEGGTTFRCGRVVSGAYEFFGGGAEGTLSEVQAVFQGPY